MCGRYGLVEEVRDERLAAQLQQAADLAARLGVSMKRSGEICPTDVAPVVAPSAAHRRMGVYPMRWGFTHPTKGMLIFNTRSETASQKPLFCTSIRDRRCLVPASHYYEWAKADGDRKAKYVFHGPAAAPLYLAGLYVRTSDPGQLPCFTILTREAAPEIRHIHLRMPVIVPFDRAAEWLSPDTDFDAFVETLAVPVTAERSERREGG